MNMTYTCTPCASIPMLARSLAANHIQGYYVPEGIKRKGKRKTEGKKPVRNNDRNPRRNEDKPPCAPRVNAPPLSLHQKVVHGPAVRTPMQTPDCRALYHFSPICINQPAMRWQVDRSPFIASPRAVPLLRRNRHHGCRQRPHMPDTRRHRRRECVSSTQHLRR